MFGKFRKKKDPPEPDRSTLVPRIKTHQFTAALKKDRATLRAMMERNGIV